jgi:hypothetical protein
MIFFSNELPCLESHFGVSYAEHLTKVRDGATKLGSADLQISPIIYISSPSLMIQFTAYSQLQYNL